MKKRFSEEQIVAILREGQSGQKTVEELCRAHGVSQPTYYVWKRRYGSDGRTGRQAAQGAGEGERTSEAVACRAGPGDRRGPGVPSKKVTTAPARREAAAFFRSRKMSVRRACRWLGLGRSWLGYVGRGRKDEAKVVRELKDLAAAHPRYGVRRLHRMLRRTTGRVVNHKRVRRLCRQHGLMLKQKRKRKRRGAGIGVPCKVEHPNHVWAYDFVEDRTEGGRKLRILTVVDEFTRACLTVEVEYRMNAKYVAQTLLRLFRERGVACRRTCGATMVRSSSPGT